ncbi:MAG TPA: PQQ-binding-like beta-propeller repeat protein [Gemmatales bacterium]|nr:PQQ-binding-like beta-propeller repeat protein [Gemmatales bacterium]
MRAINSSIMALCLLTTALASDWPGYRGSGSATASSTVPLTWSKTENLLWTAPLPGQGPASPIAIGNTVFVTASSGYKQDRLHTFAFDGVTGKKLWERQLWATGRTECHPKSAMAAPTPTADKERVYALFATADLVCFDHQGNMVWYRPLTQEYPTISNQVGMASSPILAGDTLVIPMQNSGEASFYLGINKATGKDVWKVNLNKDSTWSTPTVMTKGNRSLVLYQDDQGLHAIDAAYGQSVWNFNTIKMSGGIVGPSVIQGDKIVVAGAEFGVIKPGADDTTPQVVWKTTKVRLGYCTPVMHEDKLFTLTNNGVISCFHALEGNQLWQQRVKGNFAACPVILQGKLLVVNEEGTSYLLEPGDKEGKIIATNALGAENMLGTPAITPNRLYFRSDSMLYCVGKK